MPSAVVVHSQYQSTHTHMKTYKQTNVQDAGTAMLKLSKV